MVLLDRDGTIITETGYLLDPAHLVLIPGAGEAVARLNRAGVKVALVTNQSAVGRGWLDEAGLARIHDELGAQLARDGAHIDLILVAFEHPTEGEGIYRRDSPRRKPNPGMLLEAMVHFATPAERTCMVGDGARDVVAARRAGCAGILVKTGKGHAELAEARAELGPALPVTEDLGAAVDLLLGESAQAK
ncbi:MAG: HAD-IIIA family hydrolase [Planctomycetaceae bacterium]|nr:HAD-IIIA family hydrolase [Planctomycetaceae bacterium]